MRIYYRVPIIGYRQPMGAPVSASAESFLPLKPVHFHILLSLAAQATHGYGVRQQVEERTAGRIVLAAGTLYETLQRLARDGLVEETETPRSPTDNDNNSRERRSQMRFDDPAVERVARLEIQAHKVFPWIDFLPRFAALSLSAAAFGALGGATRLLKMLCVDRVGITVQDTFTNPLFGGLVGLLLLGLSHVLNSVLLVK